MSLNQACREPRPATLRAKALTPLSGWKEAELTGWKADAGLGAAMGFARSVPELAPKDCGGACAGLGESSSSFSAGGGAPHAPAAAAGTDRHAGSCGRRAWVMARS